MALAVMRFMMAEPDTYCKVSQVTHSLNMLNEIKSIPERGTKVITVLMMSPSCPEGTVYLTHKLVKIS